MSITTLSMRLLGASLILGLAACGEKDDDTGEPVGEVEDCSTAGDEDGDGASDCDDSDCASEPACQVPDEICDNGVDDDEDGATDCDDRDCEGIAPCPTFFPYAMGFDWIVGFDGEGIIPYGGLDSTGAPFTNESFVIVTIYEEAYFDAGDDRYSCVAYFDIEEIAIDSFGDDALWFGWELALSVSMTDDGTGNMVPATNCEGFDPEEWGGDNPIAAIEGLSWGFGVGDMGSDVGDSLEGAVDNAGLDWANDWEPYVFGGYYGFGSSSDDITVSNLNYCFGFEMAYDGSGYALVYDEDDSLVSRELGGAEELTPETLLQCQAWYLPYTSNITGG